MSKRCRKECNIEDFMLLTCNFIYFDCFNTGVAFKQEEDYGKLKGTAEELKKSKILCLLAIIPSKLHLSYTKVWELKL